MIYTLTLNPSIDYSVRLDTFVSGITNRTTNEEYCIGGKGINVSCILAQLGIKSTALGFTAGFTGDEIEKKLCRIGIRSDFIRLQRGISRINIKLKTDCESEINCQGPPVSGDEFDKLIMKIDQIGDGDTIVLAGSIPGTVSDDAYERILQRLKGRKVRIIVDAAKNLLLNCLAYRPFLIKPNRQELSEIFGREVKNVEETEACAKELMNQGARNVIVSSGGEGAVLYAENGNTYYSGVVDERVINTVGAGDSMVAGFIAGYEQKADYGYALKLGAACGNATALSEGLASMEKISDVFGKLK